MTKTDCITHIPFSKTSFFTKTILDYIANDVKIRPFYNNYPNIKGFIEQIKEKASSFNHSSRATLVQNLSHQYNGIKTSIKTEQNINLLLQENTYTITTGHQLNLFTGPLYFLYKIISTINLSEELSEKFPTTNFVPIYWMASEDHDFDEINFFTFKGKKIQWNTNQTGAVGQFFTEGLEKVLDVLTKESGTSKNAKYLIKLFNKAYIEHSNLSAATRYIVNELFGKFGLVIIDADDKSFKQEFIPYIKEELVQKTSFVEVSKTNSLYAKNYKIQVNPREINLFYLAENQRERIVFEDNLFKIKNTTISFSEAEILLELEQNPQKFSPNVIVRPLYQEVILPNLCYIGGGGELAYWFQLQGYFEKAKIPFPILLLRNSVQIISQKQLKKLTKLNISLQEIFLKQNNLLTKKIIENAKVSIDFSEQKKILQKQFLDLRAIAEKTDKSFIGSVNAQEKKQINGLLKLEKRLLRAEKRKQKEVVERIIEIQNQLFPNQSLEERQRNFSEYFLEYGKDFIKVLKENLKPLQMEFTVVTLH